MAKSAASYPITFKYGATTPPYSRAFPHRGADRAMPARTAVTVSKKLIGRSGNSGYSTGPHLHNSKFQSFVTDWLWGWKKWFKPEDKGSFKVKGRVVHAGPRGHFGRLPDGSWGRVYGNSVVIKQDRAGKDKKRIFYTYDHLSEINVKKGDMIGY